MKTIYPYEKLRIQDGKWLFISPLLTWNRSKVRSLYHLMCKTPQILFLIYLTLLISSQVTSCDLKVIKNGVTFELEEFSNTKG